jgi:L-lactate dehydrogenase complex protein LldF
LKRRGIRVTETDLGERIQQLDDQPPSHIVGPAFQKTPQDVANLFHRVYGSDRDRADPVYLAQVMREHTRPLMLEAGAGMTGANFAVAQTGAVVTVTNEGNADLSGNVPKLRICSVGIEKIVPGVEQLAVFIRLLTRSATGERITQYTSHFAGPRADGEMHVVLVDNGRTQRLGDERFWPSLKCIRCGACMNTCPVYRRSGGLSYGSTYMGPIGIIMMPAVDIRRHSELPFASTINGSCSHVCPVDIDIHEQIYEWREVMSAKGEFSATKQAAMKIADKVLSHPRAYRATSVAAEAALKVLPRFAIYNRLNAWGRRRELPGPVAETFHQWYARNRSRAHPLDESHQETKPGPAG